MRLDEDGLVRWLEAASGPALRHETADEYDVPTDGSDFQRYLDGAAGPSPEVGAGWRRFVREHSVWRVRTVHGEPSRFVSFECEWQLILNQQAGERIRVLDTAVTPAKTGLELWVVDGEAAVMHYNADHTFNYAELVDDRDLVNAAWMDYHDARAFPVWWAEHPEFHRAAWLPDKAAVGG